MIGVIVRFCLMMVAAVSGPAVAADHRNNKASSQGEAHRRPPLLPSERDNAVSGPKRPKARQVPSRYMSSSPSTSTSSSSNFSASSSTPTPTPKRCASPLVSRNLTSSVANTPSSGAKRSVSVDRRRSLPSRPIATDLESKLGNAGEVSSARRQLVTSTRSLSVSFQGESFSLPISKTKVTPASPNLNSVRKCTPERRRSTTPLKGKVDGTVDQVDNSKPIDQHRWPARTKPNFLGMSLDCTDDRKKLFGPVNLMSTLQQSMIDETRRTSFDGRLNHDYIQRTRNQALEGNSINELTMTSDFTASDSDSVSSGSNSGQQDYVGTARLHNGPTGIAVSARFWQEANSRIRRLQDPGSPLLASPVSKTTATSKFGLVSSQRTISSPLRGGVRPASPSRTVSSSPSRRIASPSRLRNSDSEIISSNLNEAPSVLSFAVDVRRGKVGENRIFDAHLLRLLYNRDMQWRFINARTEAALLVQKRSVEKNLWNAWITISDLRDSVTKKRHRLKLLRQKLKLASILKGQMKNLEEWASLDKHHSVSLFGAIEALEASTLRLPVVGALADVQSIKDAINSAGDVMQAMSTSVYSLLSEVEEMNSLVGELTSVISKGQAQLERCKDFLSALSALQGRDCSMKTHLLQLNRVTTA